jgi:heterodisulfide reductase subunit A-like polyferredoxin
MSEASIETNGAINIGNDMIDMHACRRCGGCCGWLWCGMAAVLLTIFNDDVCIDQ